MTPYSSFSLFLQWLKISNYLIFINQKLVAFNALTLMVGQQEEHLPREKLSCEVRAWLPVWVTVQITCIWFS